MRRWAITRTGRCASPSSNPSRASAAAWPFASWSWRTVVSRRLLPLAPDLRYRRCALARLAVGRRRATLGAVPGPDRGEHGRRRPAPGPRGARLPRALPPATASRGLLLTRVIADLGRAVSFVYGDCSLGAPALPAPPRPPGLERLRAPPSALRGPGARAARVRILRGTLAVDYGDRLELQAGRSALVVFASPPRGAASPGRVVAALRSVRGRATAARPLPAPSCPAPRCARCAASPPSTRAPGASSAPTAGWGSPARRCGTGWPSPAWWRGSGAARRACGRGQAC